MSRTVLPTGGAVYKPSSERGSSVGIEPRSSVGETTSESRDGTSDTMLRGSESSSPARWPKTSGRPPVAHGRGMRALALRSRQRSGPAKGTALATEAITDEAVAGEAPLHQLVQPRARQDDSGQSSREHDQQTLAAWAQARAEVQRGVPFVDEVVELLKPASRLRHLAAGEILYGDGVALDAVFILVSGGMRVTHVHADGRQIASQIVAGPAYLADAEMLAAARAHGSARALKPCEVIEIPRAAFMRALDESPRFLRSLLEYSSQRFLRLSQQYRSLAFEAAPVRLVQALRLHAEINSLKVSDDWLKIRVSVSQEELAEHCGFQRRTASRAFRWLTAHEAVKKDKGFYYINEAKLEEARRLFSTEAQDASE